MELTLGFRTQVMGAKAAERLKDRKVTQTIRSHKATYPFFSKRGSKIRVTLDDEFLYTARITEVKQRPLKDLNVFDAEIGGFDKLVQLEVALRRAGFRFKDLYHYDKTWAIQFLPDREGV